jgi:hypothetical protein
MQQTPDAIFAAAMNLPEGDRLDLVHRLLDSMPPSPNGLCIDDPDFLAELERRAADDTGLIPWSELKNE